VERIQPHFSTKPFDWLNGSEATKDAVLHKMEQHSWIHLACHGLQQKGSPMDSAFMLHDGPLDLRTISRKKLPHAKLAFLSACQTATGVENLPEEALHLAAGMLVSGYHTVIGTMWSIRDRDGPLVAEKFYQYMVSHDMKTEDGQAARALHAAVADLRESVGENNFYAWIPFIHLGV
jgi:CHAT domain-containing protein